MVGCGLKKKGCGVGCGERRSKRGRVLIRRKEDVGGLWREEERRRGCERDVKEQTWAGCGGNE